MTQDEWYNEAVKIEDGAERWFLSDIKKTMKGYLEAMRAYDRALISEKPNNDDTYNIHYNQTRLLLKIYTDYVNVDGYINLLQYVNLDGIDSVETLLVTIDAIIKRFETVVESFPEEVGWDLLFNLLISYSTYVESQTNIPGETLINIVTGFISHFHHIMRLENELLESVDMANLNEQEEEDDVSSYRPDNLAEHSQVDLRTGTGIKTRGAENEDYGLALSTETFDKETVVDTVTLGYKFVYEIMANQLESENTAPGKIINVAQKNYLEELLVKFINQLDDMVVTLKIGQSDVQELVIAKRSIESLKLLYQGDLHMFLDTLGTTDEDSMMSNVELLDMAINTFSTENSWQIRTYLSRTLGKLQTILAERQSNIISGKTKNKDNELSPIVFSLCDVMINRADNELSRCLLKQTELNQLQGQSHPEEDIVKTIELLQQNAKTLLVNAKSIAHRSCGFSEYITDKLKRNYIYGQASIRLDIIESPRTRKIPEDLDDQPSYRALCIP